MDIKLNKSGNPMVPKGDGNEVVETYINAMPTWKKDVGTLIDKMVVELVPYVRKAVRWHTVFYGVEGQGWFMAMDCAKNMSLLLSPWEESLFLNHL
jgi:hypothetical protein